MYMYHNAATRKCMATFSICRVRVGVSKQADEIRISVLIEASRLASGPTGSQSVAMCFLLYACGSDYD